MNKTNWTYKKLGEIASYINGYAFKPEQWKERGTPIIRIQNLNNPEAPYNYFDGKVPENVNINDGDLLISWSASLGTYIWHGGPAFLNQHIFKVIFDKTDIDKMFLKYAVSSKLEEMGKHVHGATMKHIVKKDFDNIKIPFPSKDIQIHVVEELESINNSINLLKQQVKDLDSLALSIFYDMFGDPITNPKGFPLIKISEVGTVVTGNTPSTKDVENYSSNDYCFIKPSDIAKEGVSNIQTSEFFISKKAYCNSRQLPKGSVLTTCIGIIGKVGILRKDATCNQQINAIVPNSDISSVFLAYTILGLRNVLEAISNAPVVPIINKGDFSKLQIPLPPQYSQQSFANKIAAIEESKASLNAQIAEMQNLLAARMQYWFD